MKKFNIVITAYLSILAFNSAYCSDMTLVKESTVLDSLETEIIDQIKELQAKGINATDSQGRTPLFLAAQYNQVKIIKELLLNKDIEIDKADNDGLTPLAIAINEQHVEAVQALLDSNSKEQSKIANVETRDNRIAYTPLMRAAHTGHVGIVKLLLAAGANPTVSVKRNERLVQASNLVSENHSEIIDLIKDKQTEYTYRTLLLIKALRDNKPDEAKKLFMAGIDVNTKDQDHYIPLIGAVAYGYKDIVQMLIEAKADVNTKHNNGSKPLICAAGNGHKDIVQLLLQSKADVNAKNTNGDTPLIWAAKEGHKDVVKMLIKAKAEVNAKSNYGDTPLIWAARYGRKDIVKMLIEAKADVNAKAQDGWTPLHWAINKNHKEIVDILKKAGAKDNKNCVIC